MAKNLETADTLVKLVLAITIVITYFTDLIQGPFAKALLVLALITVILYVTRTVVLYFFAD